MHSRVMHTAMLIAQSVESKMRKQTDLMGPGQDSSQPEIITTPQGIEAPTKLLDTGQLNGRLPSAGLASYSKLDEQTATRWVKVI